jgi:hypothetical protein
VSFSSVCWIAPLRAPLSALISSTFFDDIAGYSFRNTLFSIGISSIWV